MQNWLLVLLLLCFAYGEAAAEKPQVFVTRNVAEDMYVRVIFLNPEKSDNELKSVAAKEMARELVGQLMKQFRPFNKRDNRRYGAACDITLRDWAATGNGEPDFQIVCQSVAMWKDDDPQFKQDLPATIQGVMDRIAEQRRVHRTRLNRLVPNGLPYIPVRREIAPAIMT